jgi:hypothetical protein
MKTVISLCLSCLCTLAGFTQIPILNSYPAATGTILLDFDGQYVSGTSWNWSGPINAAPAGLTTDAVTEIFNRVAEDFRIFNLNITTDSTVYDAAPITQRVRIIITPSNSWYGSNAGGVSYVNSFTWGDNTPGWVFSNLLKNNAKNIAESASHEAGHTLGLQHQSNYDANCHLTAEYSPGTGTGQIGWAPIMGVGYSKNITTWYKGNSIIGCGYMQDDISTIAWGRNNVGFRSDDHGNSTASADPLTMTGYDFQASGLINDSLDKDVFRFNVPSTTNFSLNAIPENVGSGNAGANIDIRISLLNDVGDTIGQYNPLDLLDAGVDSNINAGNYYLVIEGVSNPNMSRYGSVGYYVINGTLSNLLPVQQLTLTGDSRNRKHDLQWQLVTDDAISSVTLQYSTDAKHFKDLGSVKGTNAYSWQPTETGILYYRILVKGINQERVHYSNIVALQGFADNGIKIENHIVHSDIVVSANANARFQLLGMSGQLIARGQLLPGINRIPVQNAPAGLLLMRIEAPGGIYTEKLMKQ